MQWFWNLHGKTCTDFCNKSYPTIYLLLKGQLIHYDESQSISSCWKACQIEEECQWFSHDFANDFCFLFKNCPEIDYNSEVVTGQRDCDYDVVKSKFCFPCFPLLDSIHKR